MNRYPLLFGHDSRRIYGEIIVPEEETGALLGAIKTGAMCLEIDEVDGRVVAVSIVPVPASKGPNDPR